MNHAWSVKKGASEAQWYAPVHRNNLLNKTLPAASNNCNNTYSGHRLPKCRSWHLRSLGDCLLPAQITVLLLESLRLALVAHENFLKFLVVAS